MSLSTFQIQCSLKSKSIFLLLLSILLFSDVSAQTFTKDTIEKKDIATRVLNELLPKSDSITIDYFFVFGLFTYGVEYVDENQLRFVRTHSTHQGRGYIKTYEVYKKEHMPETELKNLEKLEFDLEFFRRMYVSENRIIYEFESEDKRIRLVEIFPDEKE